MKKTITSIIKTILKFFAYYTIVLVLIDIKTWNINGYDIASIANQVGYVLVAIAVYCMFNNINFINCGHNQTNENK